MRAVGVRDFGGPEALEVLDLPDPEPGRGQLLVRVHAAAVNPTDTFVRSGARRQQQTGPPPFVPGMDVAGVLEAIEAGADSDLEPGDRVMAIVVPHGAHGGYAERVALPAASVVAAPAGWSHGEAATLPMNGLTARQCLDVLALEPGQTLAVTGAAGVLGGYVIQLAKAAGLRVVADAAEADEALVRDFGADVVVRRGDDVAERIRAAVPEGADGLVDASVQQERVVSAVRRGGGLAAVRGWKGPEPRGLTLHTVRVREYAEEHAKLDHLRQQAEGGVLTPRVAATFPPEAAGEAHRLLEGGGVRGRFVIEFPPPS
jgi:NADPH:quinone reductase